MQERLKELIEELDRVHPDGFFNGQAWAVEEGLPDFVLAQSGVERHFTKKARIQLYAIAATIHENDSSISSVVEQQGFVKILRKCVADLHSTGLLKASDIDSARLHVDEQIKASLGDLRTEFTHYFPAWTLGLNHKRPFVLGPVTILTQEQWIDSVDFPDVLLRSYAKTPEENTHWKASLKDALAKRKQNEDPLGLAGEIYAAIHQCPSILKVTVKGFEFELSRKVGEIVCKTALDSVSLLFGGREYFHQQALADERLPPLASSKIVEVDGYLSLPGRSLGPRLPILSHARVSDHLAKRVDMRGAFAQILNALVDPLSSSHPNLAMRWATALDWMAEGLREKNDAVAVAKIASSLDVLACGGKSSGILAMIVHLTKVQPDDIVVQGLKPKTLKAVVKEIYDDGRSQILHGTKFDRLKSFESTKSHAMYLARVALLECALRLEKFGGPDGDKVFRTISDYRGNTA